MNIKAIRYFYGCISVRISGGFSENFINDCRENGIRLWDIRNVEGSVFFFTQEKYMPLINTLAQKSGLDAEINSRFGIPYILRENKSHAVLFAGLIISLLFVAIMNTRIWVIDVSGNERLFDSQILEIMSEYGVCIGAAKKSINAPEIQEKFLKRTKDEVLWVSLNVEGMCAEIQIREIEKVENGSLGQPCNYIADFSGVITTYRVFSGTPAVKSGDYVRAGDMLIDSVVEYFDKGLSFVESRGLVIARRDKYVEVRSDNSAEKRSFLHTKRRLSLILPGIKIPLSIRGRDINCETTETEYYLYINSVRMPFGISVFTDSFYGEDEEVISEDLRLLESYLSEVALQTRSSNVISVKTQKYKATGVYELKGKIDCLDFMGRKEVINIENSG